MVQFFKDLFSYWWMQDILILGAFGFVFWILWSGSHHERWNRAWVRLRRDRVGMVAMVVAGIYMFIGALDALQIPKEGGGSKTILDFVLTDHIPVEKSYSAPLAKTLLSENNPEPLKGLHLLGTCRHPLRLGCIN